MYVSRRMIYEDMAKRLSYMVKMISESAGQDECQYVLGISRTEANELLKKIVNALPMSIINTIDQHELNAIKNFILKEFILFQCQESVQEQHYPQLFSNFILVTIQELLIQQNKVDSSNEL